MFNISINMYRKWFTLICHFWNFENPVNSGLSTGFVLTSLKYFLIAICSKFSRKVSSWTVRLKTAKPTQMIILINTVAYPHFMELEDLLREEDSVRRRWCTESWWVCVMCVMGRKNTRILWQVGISIWGLIL